MADTCIGHCGRDCNDNQGRNRCATCPGRIARLRSEPIPTEPGELDDTRRSTEGAAGLAVALALVVAIAAMVMLPDLVMVLRDWAGRL